MPQDAGLRRSPRRRDPICPAGTTNGAGAGGAYDPIADKVFLYDGTGTLYQFDPATLACVALHLATVARSMPQFLALALIGIVLFSLSLARFRKTLAAMA